jgi:mRNA interferase MazF
MEVQRGDIFIVKLEENGNIQGNLRPCIVVSNEKCNTFSPVITIVPVTSKLSKHTLPTHVIISEESGLIKISMALCEQVMSINKSQLINKVGKCTSEKMFEIEKAIAIQMQQSYLVNLNKVFEKINYINEISDYLDKYPYNRNYNEYVQSKALALAELKKICFLYNIDINLVTKSIKGDTLRIKEGDGNVKKIQCYA